MHIYMHDRGGAFVHFAHELPFDPRESRAVGRERFDAPWLWGSEVSLGRPNRWTERGGTLPPVKVPRSGGAMHVQW